MKKNCVIIFDLDGTLLNTDLLIYHSFEHVFHHYKPEYPLTQKDHLSFLGPPLKDTFRRFFDESMIDELVDYYREYNLAHHYDYVTIYPKVKETVHILKEKGYPLAVVTTKYSDAAYIGLDMFDISRYFDVVLGMDQVKHVKPDPEGILTVMKQMKCQKAVMIGDNKSDILAGKNAGVYTIGVKWTPKGTEDMEALNPDLMIDQMDEIIDYIEGVINNG